MALGAFMSCGPHWTWLGPFYHFTGFITALLCLLVWCLLPRLVRPYVSSSLEESRHTRPVRPWVAILLIFGTFVAPLCILWILAWYFTADPNLDVSEFPDFKMSPYKQPFPEGETTFAFQGNFGKFSHRYSYSYDFMRPCGSPILASRSGGVFYVEDRHDGNVWTKSDYANNYILIYHDDGEASYYHHLQQGSAMVKEGDQVEQGDPIALVGNVGRSSGPHIHFEVYYLYSNIPVSFQDVSSKVAGIPRALHFYKSGNGP